MKKLAFGALVVGLLVAAGCSDKKTVKIVDSKMVDAPGVCSPLTQMGCNAGEKCTWVVDATTPNYVGHVGCVPDGTAAIGAACMFGAPGATGYDNCAKGGVCSNYRSSNAGVCKAICDQQGGAPTCDSTHVCVTYSGLFKTGDTTPNAAGVCDLACDPLNDNDFDGSGSGVKTGTTCTGGAAVGCYGYPSFGTPPATGWSCTGDINSDKNIRHRVECTAATGCADADGTIYVNSCNQGYLPLLKESTAVSTAVCVALCKPANCFSGSCGTGNANAIGATPHRCKEPDALAPGLFADTTTGITGSEHCRYLWSFETDDQGKLLRSPTSDTLGFCFDHSKYLYDPTGGNNPTTPLPACKDLVDGFGSGSAFGAADLGCVDTTHAPGIFDGKSLSHRAPTFDDLRPLYDRTMGAK